MRIQKDTHMKTLSSVARKEAQAAAAAAQEGEVLDSEGSGSAKHKSGLPELLPPNACESLSSVVQRIVACGRAKDLCEAYM